MIPPFKIINVASVTDAISELRRLGDDAKIYAGGTELLILLRHNLVQSKYLVNIKVIPDLHAIRRANGTISIGASVTHRQLETDPTIRETLPLLAHAESQVANIRVRSQGTLGGTCFNDPHSDPATVLLVHGAHIKIVGPNGTRQSPLDQVFARDVLDIARAGRVAHVRHVPLGSVHRDQRSCANLSLRRPHGTGR